METKRKPGNPRRGRKVKQYIVTLPPATRNDIKDAYGTLSHALRFAARAEISAQFYNLKNSLK